MQRGISVALSLTALVASAAWAQNSIPAGVELRITAPKLRFYLGETIPLTLSFTAAVPRTFGAASHLDDRIGRLNDMETYIVDPPAATEDPLRRLPGENGGLGGIRGGDALLSPDKPFTVERILNEWVRFRAPGTYRLHVRSRRPAQITGQSPAVAGKRIEVVSNVLTLEIAAPPPEWISEQIAAATAVLDRGEAADEESRRARDRAGLTLRFLNTLESAVALARRLPDENTTESFAWHSGILDSHHRRELLPVLEQLLLEPERAISERFLRTLAELAVLVKSGGELRQHQALVTQMRDHYASLLVRALPKKAPKARAMTSVALLSVANAGGGPPGWLPEVVDHLLAGFRVLPERTQADLLDVRWPLLRSRGILPLLNELQAGPPADRSLHDIVLRRIYKLAPEQGRQLILDELRRPEGSRIETSTLTMLPDENLPELDAMFAAQAARGGPLPEILITRYATGRIVKEVEAGYRAYMAEGKRQHHRPYPFPLVFYFLKFDPEFGEQELRNALAAGPCYDISHAFGSLGAYAMSPALERIAIEHLTSSMVPVKRGAAEVLGRYGSPAAQPALWKAMEYFRSWWKDREADLQKSAGQESASLERTLRIALAQAGGWVLGEAELRRLLALCSTGECRADVEEWIRRSGRPKPVEILPSGGELRIQVAQYMLRDAGELQAKLAQFPAGTAFRIAPSVSEEAKLARSRVEAAIRAAKHRLLP